MDGDTLRSRVIQLIQRTRKAVRLYSSAERLTDGEHAEFTALQLEQWQHVNTELQRQLTLAVERPNPKHLNGELLTTRDRFYHEWRNAEAEVHLKQRELLASGEKGDFVRSAIIGRTLVILKAREQAAQAAHHEIQELIDRAKIDPRTAGQPNESQVGEGEIMRSQTILLDKVQGLDTNDAVAANKAQVSGKLRAEPVRGKVIQLRARQGS